MPSYAPAGYVAAVSMRTTRTLLVEGPTDKSAIARLIVELRAKNLLLHDNLVVDTADDIPNAPGGNRQRVEHLHGQVGGSDRFAALVDREFRDFDLAIPFDHAPYHRVVAHNLFWTRGHSVENYFSTLETVKATLEQHHPEHLPSNFASLLNSAFPTIVRACAAITLAAQGIHKLDRIREVKQMDFWKVDSAGNLFADVGELQTLLGTRGVDATDCAAFANYWHYYTPRLAMADLALSRWISHGHLADSHLWCAVAALLRHAGMPNAIASQVAWGTKEAQFRASVAHWCAACAAGIGEYPHELIQWLQA